MDRRLWTYVGGSAVAHGAFLVLLRSLPEAPVRLPVGPLTVIGPGHFGHPDASRYTRIFPRPNSYRGSFGPGQTVGPGLAAGEGRPHPGETGAMGTPASASRVGSWARRGPAGEVDPRIATQEAVEAARHAGVLGILTGNRGQALGSVFGREGALGNDPEHALGALKGYVVGPALGQGGLGLQGTGRGGGCGGCPAGSIGVGALGTWGKGGHGSGSGYAGGLGVGGLGNRNAHAPNVIPGAAKARGGLDKEIIRRVVRRHINELRYCFELEGLLEGRRSLDFTIAPSGQVVGATVSSTLPAAALDSCLAQAVRRWEFPRPLGGGVTEVHYPIMFTVSGSPS